MLMVSCNYLFLGMVTGIAYLGIVTALTIDNQLTVIKNDCYERLAIGQRLNQKDVYKSFEYNILAECQAACTKEENGCRAFSFGIGTKGNGTCELSSDPIKETADLKPIGTVADTDYDLYIKKLGCKVVIDKTPHDKPPPEDPGTALGPVGAVSRPYPDIIPVYEGSKPDDEFKPLENGYLKPAYASDFSSHHYLPPDSGGDVHHVQTLVSVASGPNTYLHPVHEILVGDGPYNYGRPHPPPRPSGCCEKNKDCCAPSDIPPFRPTILHKPYNDLPYRRPRPHGLDRPDPYDRPNRPYDDPYSKPGSYDTPHRPYDGPEFPYNRPNHVKPERPYDTPGRPFDKPNRPYDDQDRPYDRPNKPYDGPERPYDKPNGPYDGPDQLYDEPHRPYDDPNRPYDKPDKPGGHYDRPDSLYDKPNRPYNKPIGPYDGSNRPNRPYDKPDQIYDTRRWDYGPGADYDKPFKMPPRPISRPQNGDYDMKPDRPDDRYDLPPRRPLRPEGPPPYDPRPNSVYYDRPLPPKYGSVIPHPDYYNKVPFVQDYPENFIYDKPPKNNFNDRPSGPGYHYDKPPASQSYDKDKPAADGPYHYDKPPKPSSQTYDDGKSNVEKPYPDGSKPSNGNGNNNGNSYGNGPDKDKPNGPSNPNNPNGGYVYNKPNGGKLSYGEKGSIVSTSIGPHGEQITSIITEIKGTCFRRVLAGKRAARRCVRRSLTCETVEQCQRECADEKYFICEGFNYRLDPTGRGKGDCELLDLPLSQLDIGRDLYPDRDYDYYERDRNAASANCKQWPSRGGSYYPYDGYRDRGSDRGGYRDRGSYKGSYDYDYHYNGYFDRRYDGKRPSHKDREPGDYDSALRRPGDRWTEDDDYKYSPLRPSDPGYDTRPGGNRRGGKYLQDSKIWDVLCVRFT